jgi:hypothetical protein
VRHVVRFQNDLNLAAAPVLHSVNETKSCPNLATVSFVPEMFSNSIDVSSGSVPSSCSTLMTEAKKAFVRVSKSCFRALEPLTLVTYVQTPASVVPP